MAVLRFKDKRRGGRRSQTPGRMNRLESAYADRLRVLSAAGRIRGWAWDSFKMRLANRTWLTPDFLIMPSLDDEDQRMQFHDTKGFFEEDAKVKIKVAAGLWPWLRFFIVTNSDSRHPDRGEWTIREIPGRGLQG